MRDTQRDIEFTEFVLAQRPALVRMARLLTAGDEALAEDLVQTALTRLYVAWPRVRRAGNPVGYARTTLTHVFVDERRRPRRRESTTETPVDRSVHRPRPGHGRRRPHRAAGAAPRASARSSCSGTGSTSTSPRPPGCSAARPGP